MIMFMASVARTNEFAAAQPKECAAAAAAAFRLLRITP